MKIEKIVFSYQATRSGNYQSAKVELTVEATPDEGEKFADTYEKIKGAVVSRVNELTQEQLTDLIADAQQQNNSGGQGGYRR